MHEHEGENNINPSAPLDDMCFISFHQNLYLKIVLPKFDITIEPTVQLSNINF
jgi:hypothetical protein